MAQDDRPAPTPREMIALAIWLREGSFRTAAVWPDSFAWHERMAAAADPSLAKNSDIGRCLDRAERILRLLEAAGLVVIPAKQFEGP